MTDRQEKLMAMLGTSISNLCGELSANEYVLATVITNLRHMRGNPEAADLLLDWYDKEGFPAIQKARSAQ